MLKGKRRETEIFSLSFMDCICCGFGAVLLLFILTTGQKADYSEDTVEELKKRVQEMDAEITKEQDELKKMARPVTLTEAELAQVQQDNLNTKRRADEYEEELKRLLRQLAALKDEEARLLADLKNMPEEEQQPVPIPEVDRRQYLTGVRMEGSHVLFIVRASGSMLGDTIEDAAGRLDDPDFKKREAPKWQRVVNSLRWLVASLAPDTKFQILLFNEETVPLLPDHTDGWVSRGDRTGVQEVLTRLAQVVPKGSANLERAFNHVRYMPTLPDAIVLLTDGLPTASDTSPSTGSTDDETRILYLRQAVRQLPPRIPVSTILYPTSGDPGAPALYWELAGYTNGALVSPSADWPDI
jgi:polyhydroxyalkanoate synthesis regulator phasin